MDERYKTEEGCYAPENIMRYHTAVAVAKSMEKNGHISPGDTRKILDALGRKYGFGRHSIFTI